MSIGARYHKNKNKQKVSGADMLPGVLLSLSYNKCPIDPELYLDSQGETYVSIHWDNLGALIDDLAAEMNKEFKPLTVGSAKQYLHAMRKGYRANKNGILPPLNVSLSEEEMTLTIPLRDFDSDKAKYPEPFQDGLFWIFNNAG